MSEDTTFFQKARGMMPPYWKMATLRCSMYAAVVAWGTFNAGVEGYNSFAEMSQMQICKLVGNMVVSMFGVWIAFLDQTMSHPGQTSLSPATLRQIAAEMKISQPNQPAGT